MIFNIPFLIDGNNNSGTLTVELPKYKFKKIFNVESSNKIEFEVDAGTTPQKMIISYYNSKNKNCIILQPQVITDILNVPVRTISLKKNNVEIAEPISNLAEYWNYKSWSNPWLVNNDQLIYRYYLDFESVRNTQS